MGVRRRIFLLCGIVLVVGTLGLLSLREVKADFVTLSAEEQRHQLSRMAREQGPEEAWLFLKSAYLSPSGLRKGQTDPHMLAHLIGGFFLTYTGKKGITQCDESFTDGCFHGFVSALLQEVGLSGLATLAEMCVQTGKLKSCVHGVGHGIGEVWREDLLGALAQCSVFANEEDTCWGGVIMEKSHIGGPLANKTWSSCENLPQKYHHYCAVGKAQYLDVRGETATTISEFCASAPNSWMTNSCFGEFGYVIVRRTNGTLEGVKDGCSKVPHSQKERCVEAAVDLLAIRRPQNWEKTSPALCASINKAWNISFCEKPFSF